MVGVFFFSTQQCQTQFPEACVFVSYHNIGLSGGSSTKHMLNICRIFTESDIYIYFFLFSQTKSRVHKCLRHFSFSKVLHVAYSIQTCLLRPCGFPVRHINKIWGIYDLYILNTVQSPRCGSNVILLRMYTSKSQSKSGAQISFLLKTHNSKDLRIIFWLLAHVCKTRLLFKTHYSSVWLGAFGLQSCHWRCSE